MTIPTLSRSAHRVLAALSPNWDQALIRFPISVAAATALTAFLLFELHVDPQLPDIVRERTPLFLGVVLYGSVALALFAEARALSRLPRALLLAAGIAIPALLTAVSDTLDLSRTALLGVLMLAGTFAAFVGPPIDNPNFWRFNQHFWSSALLAQLAALIAAGGVSLVLWSLVYLFGVDIPYRTHEKVWIIAFGFIAPIYWLTMIPERFDIPVTEGRASDLRSRAIATLVDYILVPIIVAYAAILHAYAAKLALAAAMPRGRLGTIVLTYGSILVLTALLSYPFRRAGTPLTRVFWRIWPWLIPIPVVVLFAAVLERIGQYGLTESRYLVMLAGVWLALVFLSQARFVERRDLRLPVAVFTILLLVAAAGPWGMIGASTRSQVSELNVRLASAGILKEGRIPDEVRPNVTLLASDRQRINGIVAYLRQRDRLHLLKPIFAGAKDDPFAAAAPRSASPRVGRDVGFLGYAASQRQDFTLASRILARLGVGNAYDTPRTSQRSVYFRATMPYRLAAPGMKSAVGPFTVSEMRRPAPPPNDQPAFTASFSDGVITVVETATRRSSTFAVAADLNLRAALLQTNAGPPGQPPANREPVSVTRAAGDLEATAVVIGMQGQVTGSDGLMPRSVTFWLLF